VRGTPNDDPTLLRLIVEKVGFIAAGVLIGLAFHYPSERAGAVLGWVAVLVLVWFITGTERFKLNLFIYGVVLHALGFYWLPETLSRFGGFPFEIALGLFVIYCLASSLQFVLCGWLYQRLRYSIIAPSYLAFPLAWMATEYLVPRLFPWSLSHTQITWRQFALIAQGADTEVLSGLLLWWGVMFVSIIRERRISRWMLGSFLIGAALLTWGGNRRDDVATRLLLSPKILISTIQGNVDVFEKGEAEHFDDNLKVYRELSKKAAEQGAKMIFWPETVLTNWTPQNLLELRNSKFDPAPGLKVPLLYGALTYNQRSAEDYSQLISQALATPDEEYREFRKVERYNSALGIDEQGRVVGRYHKRVLMAFGEYLPWVNLFPGIRHLSPHTGNFDAGRIHTPIPFQVQTTERGKPKVVSLNIMPLICYEDLVPSLSREGVLAGATLLANLTNDAWYGKTAAPYQHHLIASWRAIQTHRYLIRATNTGYSAVVNPLGETIADLPIFSAGYLFAEVATFDFQTVYVRYGSIVAWCLLVLVLIALVLPPLPEDEQVASLSPRSPVANLPSQGFGGQRPIGRR